VRPILVRVLRAYIFSYCEEGFVFFAAAESGFGSLSLVLVVLLHYLRGCAILL